MSTLQSARLNGLDTYVYLKEVQQGLPAHLARRVAEFLPHRWVSAGIAADYLRRSSRWDHRTHAPSVPGGAKQLKNGGFPDCAPQQIL